MALDEQLLEVARRAGERAAQTERDAAVAKADYHHAIRRLQLAGATMREIAAALNLSHQRVQQIIDASGGGRRWRRPRNPDPARLVCSFCGTAKLKAEQLVAGPGVYICHRCIDDATRVAEGGAGGASGLVTIPPGRPAVCAFCGKRRQQTAAIVATVPDPPPPSTRGKPGTPTICDECLALCREIAAEDLAP